MTMEGINSVKDKAYRCVGMIKKLMLCSQIESSRRKVEKEG